MDYNSSRRNPHTQPFNLEQGGDFAVISVPPGQGIDIYTAPALRELFAQTVGLEQTKTTLLDISLVTHLDTTALNVISHASRYAAADGRTLVVDASNNERVLNAFRVTGLSKTLRIISSRDDYSLV